MESPASALVDLAPEMADRGPKTNSGCTRCAGRVKDERSSVGPDEKC
jgi:hypothetical protein